MTTAYAYINPNMLTWARDRAQLSMDMLAQKLNVKQEKIEAWERGEKHPTFKQAQNFAEKTHIPFGYLYLPNPPDEVLPLPDLRTIGGQQPARPSAELIDMVHIVMRRQEWFAEYLKEQGVERNPYVGRFNTTSEVNVVVNDMRAVLRVSAHPNRGRWEDYFNLLVERIENAGILVMRQGFIGAHSRPLSVAEFRGFAIFDLIAPVIFINQADAPSAKLFSLIHELAHIWTGKSGISDAHHATQRQEEIQCNAIAAEFLAPEVEFEQHWRNLPNWKENIAILEAHFHVSKWVIARRALTLRKITNQQYQEYVNELNALHRERERADGGPNYYLVKKGQISERFSKAIVAEALSGRVLLKEAGQLLDIKPHNIRKFATELGI